ncbi:hypothetical protein JCM10212_000137 [Sporobolomyces blumeae]
MATSAPPSPRPLEEDPEARWERIRAAWLEPRDPPRTTCGSTSPTLDLGPPRDATGASGSRASPSRSNTLPHESEPRSRPAKKPKDPVFQERIRTLERMLRVANGGEIGAAGGENGARVGPGPDGAPLRVLSVPTLLDAGGELGPEGRDGPSGRGGKGGRPDDVDLDAEVPDGGFTIGGEKKGSAQELKKVSEGIFLAFKQGRPLKESLPLSLVTSLLYRGWLLDGTIPPSYSRSLAEPDPPMPTPRTASHDPAAPRSVPPSTASNLFSTDRPPPSPLALLSTINDSAVTPLGSEATDESSAQVATGATTSSVVTPLVADDSRPNPHDAVPSSSTTTRAATLSSVEMPPPPVPSLRSTVEPDRKPGIEPLQDPTTCSTTRSTPNLEGMGADEGSGKLKLDVLRGSRWRTERDVASGSDVI